MELDKRTVTTTDMLPRQPRDFRDACARVIEGQEQGMIAPSYPRQSIWRCQQGLDFRSRQVADQFLVLTLRRNGEHAGDNAEVVRITQGHEAEKGTESGQADIA